jgi:hypothetical protein
MLLHEDGDCSTRRNVGAASTYNTLQPRKLSYTLNSGRGNVMTNIQKQ